MASEAIRVDSSSVKAWSLRGVAYMKKGDLDDATRDLKHAIKLAPQDKQLRTEWENLKKLKDENKMK